MKNKHIPALALLGAITLPASAVTVTLDTESDVQYINGAPSDRGETIIGINPGSGERLGVVRFNTTALGAATGGFTDPVAYTLTAIKLVAKEQAGRDGNNANATALIYSYFLGSDAGVNDNSGWTVANTVASTFTWHGNTAARSGNVGGAGVNGDNNIDGRSTSVAVGTAGFGGPQDGVSSTSHTFVTGAADVVEIDMLGAGGTPADIQALLADWVGGTNGGLGVRSTINQQIFLQSQNGVDADAWNLVMEFDAIPEPSTALLSGIAALGLLRRRR